MRTAIICGAFTALAITTASAQQNPYSANSILPGCTVAINKPTRVDLTQSFEQGVCTGAVMGLGVLGGHADVRLDAFNRAGAQRATKEHWHCLDIPNDTNLEQWVRVVVRYIEARPQRMHEPFMALALEALFDAWPCKP